MAIEKRIVAALVLEVLMVVLTTTGTTVIPQTHIYILSETVVAVSRVIVHGASINFITGAAFAR